MSSRPSKPPRPTSARSSKPSATRRSNTPTPVSKEVVNIEADHAGETKPDQIILVGAHYDSVMHCPGANDNGTGVAATLEIARLLKQRRFARTLRFVMFPHEEPPFFRTENMGSRVYAKLCRDRNDDIRAMLTPETIGYYSDQPGSQTYPIPTPFPLNLILPSTGHFLLFVGNLASTMLVHRCLRSFRKHSKRFPRRGVVAPQNLTGIGFSDHESFWREGYPAVMITDTAPYRYPHYHTPQDTPDKIDYDRFSRVVTGLAGTVADLARPLD